MIDHETVTSEVFVDYLDCTYSPDNNPVPQVESLLQSCGACCTRPSFGSKSKTVWDFDGGSVHIAENAQWVRISSSGRTLENLRSADAFHEYLNVLSSSPHKVTRIDVSVDVSTDAAVCIQSLRERYPSICKLSKKPVKTRSILSTRTDGVETGSFYVGDRKKAEVTAVCYDKQHEAYEQRGEIIPPTMRYELRVKSGVRPTLADALDPAPLFWHYCGNTLLPRPLAVSDWDQGREFNPWVNSWVPPTKAATMIDRVENSPELLALAKLAHETGPRGREMLLSLVTSRIDSHIDKLESSSGDLHPSSSPDGSDVEGLGSGHIDSSSDRL